MDPSNAPPSELDADKGLADLQSLVETLSSSQATGNYKSPIVLVSGFSGWDAALFGTLNYWGGFADLPQVLHEAGFPVIVVRIGPISSNWERACEVYAQLTEQSFDSPDTKPSTLINIDYGEHFPTEKGYQRFKTDKPAVLFGSLAGWKWGPDKPVHFICHSQGGNTVRYLVKLMEKGSLYNSAYFQEPSRADWVKSVVTLGTPHKGTTITSVLKELAPPGWRKLLTQVIVSTSYSPPLERFYDLHLDQWGFARTVSGNRVETFQEMYDRLQAPVENWINSNHNGFFDNSVEGVAELNEFAAEPPKNVYYFTMSFTATIPFPKIDLTAEDLSTFPTRLSHLLPPNGMISIIPSGIFGTLGTALFNVASGALVDQAELARWLTTATNRHLQALGYPITLPNPGSQIPRSDMIPPMAPTAYGMGGYQLTSSERELLERRHGNKTVDDAYFQPNDGIVNTESMRGPDDQYIESVAGFPSDATDGAGVYWNMGPNKTMDHADEIGVFTEQPTSDKVVQMYKDFAKLLAALP